MDTIILLFHEKVILFWTVGHFTPSQLDSTLNVFWHDRLVTFSRYWCRNLTEQWMSNSWNGMNIMMKDMSRSWGVRKGRITHETRGGPKLQSGFPLSQVGRWLVYSKLQYFEIQEMCRKKGHMWWHKNKCGRRCGRGKFLGATIATTPSKEAPVSRG